MWMMGYNDGGGGDPFNGRKLRTIVPRPGAVINPTNCLGRINGAHDLLSFNHHLAAMSEQSKREFSPQQVVVSSRWNPTPEQLQTLEELYRRGTRTPSADEIQHITAQLRRYGKIEGKNVFYWFQNHKARERQKRRRQLESSSNHNHHNSDNSTSPNNNNNNSNDNNNVVENTERKGDEELGGNGTGIEAEGTKNWPSSTNCSTTTLAEKTGASTLERTAKAAAIIPECRVAGGWVHFDEEEEEEEAENQQRNKSLDYYERNATWHLLQQQQQRMQYFSSCCSSSLSPPPPPPPSSSSSSPNNHHHPVIINSSTCSTTDVINSAISTTIPALTPLSSTTVLMDQKHLLIKPSTTTTTTNDHHHHHHHQVLPSFFMNPYISNHEFHDDDRQRYLINVHDHHHQPNHSDQTLQLFPLRNADSNIEHVLADHHKDHHHHHQTDEGSVEAMDHANIINNTPPYKFFEFLPLKNSLN